MDTLGRPFRPGLLRCASAVAAVAALAFGAAACGPRPTAAPGLHRIKEQPIAVAAALGPASRAQLVAATLTTADLAGSGLTAHPPLPHSAVISAESPEERPEGACAPIAAAWQAGAPLYPSSVKTDVELTRGGDPLAVISVHLGAYTGPAAHAYLAALTSALRSCDGYRQQDLRIVLRQHVTAMSLNAGDESVAWQQESVASDGGELFMSVVVFRVGSTVVTAVMDRNSSTPVPLPDRAVIDTQIRKLRAAVH